MDRASLFGALWSIVAQLGITVVGSVAAAFAAFKYLADRWLTAKFNESLESFKHSQQKELEHLRFKINALMDRTIKLHQYEFDILPEVWGRLNEAFWSVNQFTSPLQNYPDLDRLSKEQLDEFFSDSSLKESEKNQIRSSSKKGDAYFKIIFWHKLREVKEKYYDFAQYYVKNKIFISKELSEKIENLRNLVFDALHEREFEEQHPNPRPGRFEAGDKLRKEGEKVLNEISQNVQDRLWSVNIAE